MNNKENERLGMASPNLVNQNIEKLAGLFPNCVTETAEGKAIDFELLKQELSPAIADSIKERYRLEWPGKREAIVTANLPTAKTLRPKREESTAFDNTENIYIEGDNLEVLKLLQESYLGKIKLIYIDPPYNTGNDFVYKDNFTENKTEHEEESGQRNEYGHRLVANPESSGRYHSDWLTMMYPRLKLARNLLTDNGVIYISIDDNEVHNLRKICDEIFGEQNFVSTIVWEKRYSPQNAVKWFSEAHDFLLVYAKNKLNWHPNLLERSDAMNARYRNLDNDPRGVWKPADATAQAGHGTKSQFYVLTAPNGKQHAVPNGRCWVYTEPVFQQMVADNRIWFGTDGNNVPAVKRFLSEVKQGTACQTIWKYGEVGHNQEGKKELNVLFPESAVFETPKPVRLLQRILQLSTEADSVILDFFAGSASTAHAVMQLNAEDGGNRKFIMVQVPESTDENSEAYKAGFKNICEIGEERIRRAGKNILAEQRKSENKKGQELSFDDIKSKMVDIGFRVYRLDSSNMQDVYYAPKDYRQGSLDMFANNIKPDRNPEDLLVQVMLDWGLPLSLKIERREINGKELFTVAGNSLYACFANGIDEQFAKQVAADAPLRIVFRDAGFKDDTAKINVKQLLKQLSPETEMKVI